MTDSTVVLNSIADAEIDGRARTPYFILDQLTILYENVVDSAADIRDCIRRDTGFSNLEIETELFLTFSAMRQHVSQANPATALHEEYCLARGENAAHRRSGYGIAYIAPHQHALCYSTVVPLSAAIAAGNCVIVEVRKALADDVAARRCLLYS